MRDHYAKPSTSSARAAWGPRAAYIALARTLPTMGLLAGWLLLGLAPTARAQTAEDIERARAQVALEPPVRDIVRAALRYFRVTPEAVDRLRSSARARGFLPLFAGGYRYDDLSGARNIDQSEGTVVFKNQENSGQQLHSFTLGAVWDFRELMMNPAEIQAYGLVGVQRDVMLEVSRVFYLRRQIVLKLLLRPSDDPVVNMANEVRVEELTAILDVLTDGWFTREHSRRIRNASRQGGLPMAEPLAPQPSATPSPVPAVPRPSNGKK
jgi:hypothetical protein